MRSAVLVRRQPDARRERIMREFEQTRRIVVGPSLRWALGMAAVVLAAVAVGQVWRNGLRATDPAKNPIPGASRESARATAESAVRSAAGNTDVSSQGEFMSRGDFIEVPYTPPLATGEFVRVVHTELRPTALARMGIYVDAAETDEIPADVLLGEDGFPRGIRVLEAVDF